MPATLDFSRSPSSGYCYGLVNRDSELMTDPRFLSSWYDTEAASNSCRLPRLPSSTYGNPSEVFQDPVDRSAVDGDERPSLPWAAESSHELAPPSYLPNTPGSCSYAGLHSIEGGNQQWNVPSYSFGYPTPQSDLSLSPPQHIHRVFPLDSPDDNIRRNGLHTASDRADAQEEFKGLAAAGRQFSHNPRLTSSEQAQFPYGQGRDDQEPPDLNEVIDEDGNVDSEPYAQLIFRALKSAPGHRMVLKDIYQWFEKYTNKATGNSKGWQNSIRHNLSMNGGFKKVDQDLPADDAKRGFIWVLEPSALTDGVKSTTRYRKSGSNKRVAKTGQATSGRQRTGAKSGRAARNAAKVRRSTRMDGPRSWYSEDVPLQSIELPLPNRGDQPLTPSSIWTPDEMESFFGSASRSLTPISTGASMYSYADIAGVTDVIPNGPLFAEECEDMDTVDLMAFHSSFISDNAVPTSPNHKLQQT